FSSRRRHTRSKRDWSSDVCSSDLPGLLLGLVRSVHRQALLAPSIGAAGNVDDLVPAQSIFEIAADLHGAATGLADDIDILVGVNFLVASRNIAHRNVLDAARVVNRVFVVLADID